MFGDLDLALGEEGGIVEVAVVIGDAVEAAEVDGAGHLLARDQRLVELLAMAGADDRDRVVLAEDLLQRLGEVADGRGRRLLDEDVALLAVGVGVEDQIDRFLERHQEARHVGVGDRERHARA